MYRLNSIILAIILVVSFAPPVSSVILFSNNATSLVADAGGISDVDTSVTVTTGDGALFPNPTTPDYFMATLVDASANREIVQVTARAGDVLTIVRAQEGTAARAFAADSIISNRLTAGVLDELAGSVVQGVYFLSNYASLSAAITAIGATEAELVIDQDDTMPAPVTVPDTLAMRFIQGSVITTGGNALVLNGEILAGDFQVISGSGVTNNATGIVYDQWTGGSASKVTVNGKSLGKSTLNSTVFN